MSDHIWDKDHQELQARLDTMTEERDSLKTQLAETRNSTQCDICVGWTDEESTARCACGGSRSKLQALDEARRQLTELARLREYEKATRNTICWNVECHHQAEALDMMAAHQEELDLLKQVETNYREWQLLTRSGQLSEEQETELAQNIDAALKNLDELRSKKMSDEEFLNYCYHHSKTERALFAAGHCRRLFELAGEPFPEPTLGTEAFRSMDFELVGPLVERARKKGKK